MKCVIRPVSVTRCAVSTSIRSLSPLAAPTSRWRRPFAAQGRRRDQQGAAKNPAETFLIEGHTDAVGSDESNLVLSDERAASVANVLTDVYGIPPENLATQGYGERYLKVQTLGPEQQNRRVTIRRVTPLVKPIAQN